MLPEDVAGAVALNDDGRNRDTRVYQESRFRPSEVQIKMKTGCSGCIALKDYFLHVITEVGEINNGAVFCSQTSPVAICGHLVDESHIDVSWPCEYDPKFQEYCVFPHNLPQFDSEEIPCQAPEMSTPMILNGPTSRNRYGYLSWYKRRASVALPSALPYMKCTYASSRFEYMSHSTTPNTTLKVPFTLELTVRVSSVNIFCHGTYLREEKRSGECHCFKAKTRKPSISGHML
ncbi:hypothetical protein ANN_18746 [Periplaneta americana]|uniref:Uncharacterized protein n=1 Tax=Periplaneta americana TaxID=6978 RepID=A0ABQ8SPM1_PERAM|nr:hypothetical protein ANN_18746 [Periplaneta americana]